MTKALTHLLFALLTLFAVALKAQPLRLDYEIIAIAPHDKRVFTQGLYLHDNWLFESGGGYGKSLVRRYDVESGRVASQYRLPSDEFAEGLTYFNDAIYLLTWKKQKLYVLSPDTLQPTATLPYKGEGWGLTHDGERFIMSNGSDELTFRNSKTFDPERTIQVHDDQRRWPKLNELEFAHNLIWANVWQEPRILVIEPHSGRVVGIADFSPLVQENSTLPSHTVLNGIAYDASKRAFWITGKNWPRRYLVKVEIPPSHSTPSE